MSSERYGPSCGQRWYHRFQHREAIFRFSCEQRDAVCSQIVRQRAMLDDYIARQPLFRTVFEPIVLLEDAPEVACRMGCAARAVGVGPMAAVAGAMAQLAVEAGRAAGATDVVVDNGGDIYLDLDRPIVIGLFAGERSVAGQLGLTIEPQSGPLAVCSSSGRMGHSSSLGRCDLATVISRDAALADAAATQAANHVRRVEDVDAVLDEIMSIEGIRGILVVQGDHIGLAGTVPDLVKMR